MEDAGEIFTFSFINRETSGKRKMFSSNPRWLFGLRFLSFGITDIWVWIILCADESLMHIPVHYKVFSSIPVHSSPTADSTLAPVVTTKSVSRDCQMSHGYKSTPGWEPLHQTCYHICSKLRNCTWANSEFRKMIFLISKKTDIPSVQRTFCELVQIYS